MREDRQEGQSGCTEIHSDVAWLGLNNIKGRHI